ncbi:sensor histidine kinase [Gordoniibacillus kamchatkensis]|uniref:sensor histidine kinase n=1 Tax=Gordoniibacillus kamchatkensis TaxID=1590651 RepID=UPI000697DE9E|nr:HAMP domain-containing sensor histidine kinase [Paenibacillus sp. VKM B-2647]
MAKKKLKERFPFHLLGGLIHFAVEVLILIKTNVQRSIRIQLMLTFAVCSVAAIVAYGVSTNLFGEVTKTTYLDYSSRYSRVENEADNMVSRLQDYERDKLQESGNEGRSHSVQAAARPAPAVPAPPLELSNVPNAAAAVQGQAAGAVPVPGTAAAQPAAPATGQGQAADAAPVPGSATAQPDASAQRLAKRSAEPSAPTVEPARDAQLDGMIRNAFASSSYPGNKVKMMLVDMNGDVKYKTQYVSETHVDVFALLSNLDDNRRREGEATAIRPVELGGRKLLLVASGYTEPAIVTRKGQSPLSLLGAALAFIVLFYWMTRKKMRSIEELAAGMKEISRGNLDHRVAERSSDEIGSLATHINLMAYELQHTIEEERRAERTKSELITNVSHDLRTPLTLIMGYLRLLKDKNYESPEQAEQYLHISYSKAEKLKQLIEDLFEYTKLESRDIPLRFETLSLNELLDQLAEELVTVAENERLFLSRSLPADKVFVRMDPDKMIRVSKTCSRTRSSTA